MTPEEKEIARRMKCALGLLVNNLEAGGDQIEALKPISAGLAYQMAEVARAAYFNVPNEKLDSALSNFQG